jgi:hypothetical protein
VTKKQKQQKRYDEARKHTPNRRYNYTVGRAKRHAKELATQIEIYGKFYRGIRIPTPQRLQIYGGTVGLWMLEIRKQDGKDPITGEPLLPENSVIDHEDVEGYSRLPSEERWARVRGVVNSVTNSFLIGSNNLATARSLVKYLESHEQKKNVVIAQKDMSGDL